jgi:hypothetical protein
VLGDIVLLGMHVLPSQHELAPHQSVPEPDEILVSRHRSVMSHALDRAVAGVRVDRRPGENERVHLVGKTRRDHRRGPAALAKPDKIHPAAEVVDGDDQFFEVVVDVEVLHVVGRGLPVG